jgi:hypothetical protein
MEAGVSLAEQLFPIPQFPLLSVEQLHHGEIEAPVLRQRLSLYECAGIHCVKLQDTLNARESDTDKRTARFLPGNKTPSPIQAQRNPK